jgi:DedD protein
MEKENETQKSNLEDIMINNGDGQKQLKKILMIVALVIVVLIVAIAATKMIIGGDDKQEKAAPVATPAGVGAQDREPLFEEVPMESANADAELEKMITQLRDSETREREMQKVQDQAAVPTPPPAPAQEVKQTQPKETVAVQEPTPAPAPKASSGEHDPYKVSNGWYVQVGSFSKFSPNQGFLKSIKDKGYEYFFYRTQVNNQQVTKVIIGPYADKKEADAHKERIKKEINENAFSFRVADGN